MKILYVCHRIPYPPDKGEKIRAYHQIRHLGGRHDVHLFCLADRKEDLRSAEALRTFCRQVEVIPLNPLLGRIKLLSALLKSCPLTLSYFHSPRLMRRVRAAAAGQAFDVGVAYSSSMIPYLSELGIPWVIDYVDLDSQKWLQYADGQPFPLSWLYSREARKLFDFELASSERAGASIFVTEREGRLLEERGSPNRLCAISLGVDFDYYRLDVPPDPGIAALERPVIIFVGNMDYRPNFEAVLVFARHVLPRVTSRVKDALFLVVGANPPPKVKALHDGKSVIVTGRVPDPRPFLKAADLSVVPLFMARGIQTKVLEAMAMELPVVLTSTAADSVGAEKGRDYLVADDHEAMAGEIVRLLGDEGTARTLAEAGRKFVEHAYRWDDKLARYEKILLEVAGHSSSKGKVRASAKEL
ncbi:MAG: TIGR03087 family PEP-CTERM/XrtA system glycosyltransferase [Planctomycetota bacterium]|jgi:sugar transferase (PEP-CTERM/EpsH1 system associated)